MYTTRGFVLFNCERHAFFPMSCNEERLTVDASVFFLHRSSEYFWIQYKLFITVSEKEFPV